MNDENNKRDFDFRRLLPNRDGPHVQASFFPRVDGMETDPEHLRHGMVVRYYLGHTPLPGAHYPWDPAVRDCAAAVQEFDGKAVQHLAEYEHALTAVVNGVVRTHEGRNALPANEMALEHAYISKAWETLNLTIDYFRNQHPSIAKHHHVPSHDEFEQSLPFVFVQAHAQLNDPDAPTAQPRQITRVGELIRHGRSAGLSPDDARAWAQQKIEATVHRQLPRLLGHDAALEVRTRMMQVVDPVSGGPWYTAFRDAAIAQEARLQKEPDRDAGKEAISKLRVSWHRLDNSLIIYAEVLRHNHLHPNDRKPTDSSFAHLVDSVADVFEQLPQDVAKLPSARQFGKLRLSLEAAAVEVAEQEKSSHVKNISEQRRNSSKEGGGPAAPLGGR